MSNFYDPWIGGVPIGGTSIYELPSHEHMFDYWGEEFDLATEEMEIYEQFGFQLTNEQMLSASDSLANMEFGFNALEPLDVVMMDSFGLPAIEAVEVGVSEAAMTSGIALEGGEIASLLALSPLVAAAVVAVIGVGYVINELTKSEKLVSNQVERLEADGGRNKMPYGNYYNSSYEPYDRQDYYPPTWPYRNGYFFLS